LVRRDLHRTTANFLEQHGLNIGQIAHFVCHPGGAKVIEALEEAFGLDPGRLTEARSVLRDFGNMSAATVLFVLERTLQAEATGRILMTALGPGFTAGFQLIEA
jgi:alkylresorcinol/alkylpyrone synthase